MLQATIQPNELAALMRRRTETILQSKAAGLDLNWAKEFSPSQLTACCKRMADDLVDVNLLFGTRFKTISLRAVAGYPEEILMDGQLQKQCVLNEHSPMPSPARGCVAVIFKPSPGRHR